MLGMNVYIEQTGTLSGTFRSNTASINRLMDA